VKILSPATVERIACYPLAGFAYLPQTGAPKILAALVSQEYVGSMIERLSAPQELPRVRSQSGEITRLRDNHQEIDVFGINSVRGNRAKKADPLDTRELRSRDSE